MSVRPKVVGSHVNKSGHYTESVYYSQSTTLTYTIFSITCQVNLEITYLAKTENVSNTVHKSKSELK